jgi:hypothetical protein
MENKINDINNSCNGRGCRIYILPLDRRIKPIYSKVLSKRYDIQKMVFISIVSLDKMVA